MTDFERFQMEISEEGKIHLRSNKLMYWTVRGDNSIGAETEKPTPENAFTVDVRSDR